MRAIQQREFGGPEVLELVELPTPEPGEGEVLVRVTRAGLNFADTHTRENTYLAEATLPLVPGAEVAGIREDTGERVVALCGTGGYAEYATAPEGLTVPLPDGVDDGTGPVRARGARRAAGDRRWHLSAQRGGPRPRGHAGAPHHGQAAARSRRLTSPCAFPHGAVRDRAQRGQVPNRLRRCVLCGDGPA